MDEEKGAFVINVQHFLDLLILGVEEGAHLGGDCGIGDQVIDPAILVDGFLDEVGSICLLPDMANNSISLIPLAFDFADGLFNVLFVTAGNDHTHSLLSQAQCNTFANACTRGCNDRNFALH